MDLKWEERARRVRLKGKEWKGKSSRWRKRRMHRIGRGQLRGREGIKGRQGGGGQ